MGTPEFAVEPLKKIISSHHEVVAVVTQPDKPVGRNKQLQQCPVKKMALENNIPVYQFNKIRLDGVETINQIEADIIVTCAYGQILSKEILFAKKFGVINIHGSLLPKYRGASPIQSAIINGEKTTGITILKSDVGIDDGDMILKSETSILENETYGELAARLSHIGAETVLVALDLIESGHAVYTKQNDAESSHCTMFPSDFGKLDFENTAADIVNLINGINPSPVAFMYINGKRYKVYNAHLYNDNNVALQDYRNGEVVIAKSKVGLIIKASDGLVSIDKIQAENGKVLNIKDFLNSGKIVSGDIVSNE